MSDLAVKIGNEYMPLTECDWVFREPCGCPFGVMSAVSSHPPYQPRVIAADEDSAWREFYEHARERNVARKRGITTELMTHERYGREVMPLMLRGSAHVCGQSPAVA